jgi:hypothetical protein
MIEDDLVLITPEDVKEAVCEEIATAIKKVYGVDIFQLDRDQLRLFLRKVIKKEESRQMKWAKWLVFRAGGKLVMPALLYLLRSASMSYIF